MSNQPPNNEEWQQPQQPQQPQPGYPPYYQQQYPQMPPQPPRKKRGPLFWILIIIAALLACGAITNVASRSSTNTATTASTDTNTTPTQDTPVPTATLDSSIATSTPVPTQPAPAPATWSTTHTFSGNGSKKTAVFTVPDDWKIVWKCNPASFYGGSYNVIITVYNSDATYADSGVNATCSKTDTHDETEEHQSGDVYLDIISEGDWTVQIQEFK